MRLITLIILAVLTGCATTEQGKSIQQGHNADIASTAFALLANTNAVEANPAALPMLPVKLSIGYLFETGYCREDAKLARMSNTVTNGLVVNNVLVGLSVAAAPVVGVAGAIGYWAYHDELQPDVYECRAPADVAITVAAFADMYNAEDAASVAALFAEEAVTPNAHHRGHIEYAYQQMFANADHRIQDMDGPWLHRDGYVTWLQFEDGLWYEWLIQTDGQQIAWSSL